MPPLICSDSGSSLMEQMVEALCLHAADESPTVRRVCLRGLVQVLVCFLHPQWWVMLVKTIMVCTDYSVSERT